MPYTEPWQPAFPVGTSPANQIDVYIRDDKVAVGERLADVLMIPDMTDDPLTPEGIVLNRVTESKILGGTTSIAIRNAADNANNILVEDNGDVTIRGELTVPSIVIGTDITLTNDILFSPDNTHDIGASGASRPRTIYAGTSVVAPAATITTLTSTTVTATNITGTIQTASQPNITTIGTLGSLSVSGKATSGGLVTTQIVSLHRNVDNSNLRILGGTDTANFSNATISLYGSTEGSTPGRLDLGAGISAGDIRLLTGNAVRLTISNAGAVAIAQTLAVTGAVTGASFSGVGTSLTALNATQLTSGTVPTARLTGDYSGITGVGTLTSLELSGVQEFQTASARIELATDNGVLQLSGGAEPAVGNGAQVLLYGNGATSGLRGLTIIRAGNPTTPTSTDGVIQFRTGNNQLQWTIDRLGDLNSSGADITTGGDISAGFFIGDGSQLTNVAASSVNANDLLGTTLASNVVTSSLTTVGTIGTGVWQGTVIDTAYTAAKVIGITGTTNRITIGGTTTNPTINIATTYVGQGTITTVGTITNGTWNGEVIQEAFIGNLPASKITSGTIASARISGSYTGITTVGTLTSLTVSGNATVGGTLGVTGTTTLGTTNVGGNLTVTGNIVPSANNTYNLGSDTNQFSNLFVDIINSSNVNTLNIFFSDAGGTPSSEGQMNLNGGNLQIFLGGTLKTFQFTP